MVIDKFAGYIKIFCTIIKDSPALVSRCIANKQTIDFADGRITGEMQGTSRTGSCIGNKIAINVTNGNITHNSAAIKTAV